LLESGEPPRSLATRNGDFGCLDELAQLGPRSIDHRGRQQSGRDRGQDTILDEIGRAVPPVRPGTAP